MAAWQEGWPDGWMDGWIDVTIKSTILILKIIGSSMFIHVKSSD